jgi:hypothetical protein
MELLEAGKMKVLSAAAGAGLVATLGLGMVAHAQDSTGTPTPETQTSPESTPSTGEESVPSPNFSGVEEEKAALTDYATRVTTQLADLQSDRDSVTTGADLSAVDDLIAKANDLLGKANTSLTGNDVDSASTQLMAANMTARAAETLLKASLADFGLPSQQAAASEILAQAFSEIDNITGELASTTNADATTYLTTAQDLYKQAYDLYNAGTYQQAAGTARAAAHVAQAAGVLDGSIDISFGGRGGKMHDGNGPGRRGVVVVGPNGSVELNPGGMGDAANPDEAAGTPEEVPAPSFT